MIHLASSLGALFGRNMGSMLAYVNLCLTAVEVSHSMRVPIGHVAFGCAARAAHHASRRHDYPDQRSAKLRGRTHLVKSAA